MTRLGPITFCATLLALLGGCGAAEPAPPAAPTPVAAPPETRSVALPPDPDLAEGFASDAGAGATKPTPRPALAPATTSAAESPLPSVPPKPVTIPLAPPGEESAYATAIRAGDDAYEKNDLAAAERAYTTARKLAPKRAPAAVGLARTKIAKSGVPFDYGAGQKNAAVKQAAADLARIVQANKDDGAALAELGRAELLLGEADKVVSSLKRAAELLPDVAEVQSSLGIALLAAGRAEEALAAFRVAATLDKGSAIRHSHYGTALLLRGQQKEAIVEYDLAARMDPNDARAHSDLGTALLSDGQTERAVRELERAIAIDPKRATFQSCLGYALQLMGRRDAAIAKYREAIRLDDKLASAWINLATALAQDPKTRADARAALERARAIDPTDPRVSANLKELDELERSHK